MHCQSGTLLLEDILSFKTQSFAQDFKLIKNPDVPLATKSLPLYSKQQHSKNNSIKSNNQRKQSQSIKARK